MKRRAAVPVPGMRERRKRRANAVPVVRRQAPSVPARAAAPRAAVPRDFLHDDGRELAPLPLGSSFIFGVPAFRRYDLLDRLLGCLGHSTVQPDRVVIVDNGGNFSRQATDRLIVLRPGRNIGVSGAWNLMIEEARARGVERLVIANDDIEIGPRALHRLLVEDRDLVIGCGFSLFALRTSVIDRVGWFDESFFPAYCLTPDTPILTSDLRWIPLGDVRVGQELVGVEEEKPHFMASRKYRSSTVTSVIRRIAPVVRIILKDGREVRCTPDHRWLTKPPARTTTFEWRETRNLASRYMIVSPLDVWSTSTSYDEGWLAGILDGEGHIRWKGRYKCGVGISQKEGAVLDKIKTVLKQMGIPFGVVAKGNGVMSVEIGIRRHVFRLLGSLRPVRLLQTKVWDGKHLRSRTSPNNIQRKGRANMVEIERIEPAGTSEVITLETTTKTFLANGLVSHNCEDVDYHRRVRLAGVLWSEPGGIPVRHAGSATLHSLSAEQQSRFGQKFMQMQGYYAQKWGGPMGRETFVVPFNGSPPAGWQERPVTLGGVSPDEPWLR